MMDAEAYLNAQGMKAKLDEAVGAIEEAKEARRAAEAERAAAEEAAAAARETARAAQQRAATMEAAQAARSAQRSARSALEETARDFDAAVGATVDLAEGEVTAEPRGAAAATARPMRTCCSAR